MTFNELLELDKQAERKQTKRVVEKRPSGRRDVSRSEPTSGSKKERILVQPSGRRDVARSESRSRRKKEIAFGRPSGPLKERTTDRRPYDFFRDQLLWLNRTKVEIQEEYGRRVTANAMVQLALDLFIEDYKRRKERSKLITHLVSDQRAMGRPNRGTEDPPVGTASERPSGGN